ncbi:hypothetical protein [Rhizobium ruizarguesonis]|uniref:hypothetical protein n=1 Tax=Rhizobium ruizarguesonis TaxID=2081791 RepID=UPI00143FA976|nr:hypothetical protein [Rhizobium ruizarguesonis]
MNRLDILAGSRFHELTITDQEGVIMQFALRGDANSVETSSGQCGLEGRRHFFTSLIQ